MESVMVKYDGTVRNQIGQLIQFTYGEDGLAGEYVEWQSIISLEPANQLFEHLCKFDSNLSEKSTRHFLTNESLEALDDEWRQLNEDRRNLRVRSFRTATPRRSSSRGNIDRLIYNAKKNLSDLQSNSIERLAGGSDPRHSSSDEQFNRYQGQRSALVRSAKQRDDADEHSPSLVSVRPASPPDASTDRRRVQLVVRRNRNTFSTGASPARGDGRLSWLRSRSAITGHADDVEHVSLRRCVGEERHARRASTEGNHQRVEATEDARRSPSISPVGDDERRARNANKCSADWNICTLRKVMANTAIYYDPDPQETLISEDQEWVNTYYEVPDQHISNISPWLLRIELDRTRMTDKGLTMEQVSKKIAEKFGDGLHVIFNDDNAEKLVFRIRTIDQDEGSTLTGDEKLRRYLEASSLSELTLQGIKAISKVYMVHPNLDESKKRVHVNDEGKIEKIAEWMLETDGSSLQEVLVTKDVDARRTYTNDIVEILAVLGIEAARKAIEREMNHVISFDGSYVNYRHLALLCDVMTTKGHLMPVTRHGINRQEVGPIMRCSFEQTVDVLMEAAAHAESDPLKGVSENILLGQLAQIGTGSFDLLLDVEKSAPAMEHQINYPMNNSLNLLMGSAAQRLFNERDAIGSTTPWNNQLSTTPQHLYPPNSPAYSSTSPSYLSYQNSIYAAKSPHYRSPSPSPSPSRSTLPFYSPSSPSYSPCSPSTSIEFRLFSCSSSSPLR